MINKRKTSNSAIYKERKALQCTEVGFKQIHKKIP